MGLVRFSRLTVDVYSASVYCPLEFAHDVPVGRWCVLIGQSFMPNKPRSMGFCLLVVAGATRNDVGLLAPATSKPHLVSHTLLVHMLIRSTSKMTARPPNHEASLRIQVFTKCKA